MKFFNNQAIFLFLAVAAATASSASATIDERADIGLRGAATRTGDDTQRDLEGGACGDIEGKFKLKKNGSNKKKRCSWVQDKPEKRCDLKVKKVKGETAKLVRDVCPETCGDCPALPPPEYSIEQCGGFVLLDFNIFNYAGYEKYFDEDSNVVLAQAGVYQGPKDIEEYVRFADDSSPYIDEKLFYNATSGLAGFDPATGTCVFNVYSAQGTVMNEITRGGTISYGAIQKIYYSIPKNTVTSDHIYYTTEFLAGFFHTLDTAGVNEFICDVLTGPGCQDINALNGDAGIGMSREACVDGMAELPVTDGDLLYIDGDSQGCRALHAVFAESNPFHCAHLSLAPAADPNGNVKCQVSAGLQPTDMFTEEEILQLNRFCEDQSQIGDGSCFAHATHDTDY